VANSHLNAYFKVPNGWHEINGKALTTQFKAETGSTGPGWLAAYQAGDKPTASDLLSFNTTQPFVFSEMGNLSSTASSEMSYNQLRDSFLPVTSTSRTDDAQSAQEQGTKYPLSGFKQLRDQVLTPGQGVHGVWEIFDYTYTGGTTDTFDEIALTNADQTAVYVLVVHCTTSCFNDDQAEINDVMSSFTVRSP
jgi:hypothetical protein